jgi:hypothetical protein
MVEIKSGNQASKEKRILSVLEPITQQHRLCLSEDVIQQDFKLISKRSPVRRRGTSTASCGSTPTSPESTIALPRMTALRRWPWVSAPLRRAWGLIL